MTLKPLSLKEANEYIIANHRHHGRVQGHKFSVGLLIGGKIVGCAVVGRPVARALDDGWTAEVTRLCTDGTGNACSRLYAACARAAGAMGYRRIITYILDSEPGVSLRATGWERTHTTSGGTWDRPNRARTDKHPTVPKTRWERSLVGSKG